MSAAELPDDCLTREFRAMGGPAAVTVVGADRPTLARAAAAVGRRIEELEQRWSRFVPDSDISRLNRASGRALVVDDSTVMLVEAMVDAWRATNGAFDPTLLGALNALGYASDWNDPSRVSSGPMSGGRSSPGAIRFDGTSRHVSVPRGSSLDAGGIGKGLTADLATAAALDAGATGALVTIGGDLRVRGSAPQPGGWVIGVADPYDDARELCQLRLLDGAVATSGTLRRRWRSADDSEVHHLLDPSSGRPSSSAIVQTTVVAGTGAWAEAWTKAIMVRGFESVSSELDELGLAAMCVHTSGACSTNNTWLRFATAGASSTRGDCG